MAKKIEEDYCKRFMNGFKILCSSGRNGHKVWSDLMLLYACTLANSVKIKQKEFEQIWQEREDRYLKTIRQYSKREQKIIVQMFSLLAMEVATNPNQDLLGRLYMMLEISNKNVGQFFTPYSVCELMAGVTYDRKQLGKIVHQKGYVSICDCVCGAGATLIAASEQCKEYFKKYNYLNHTYYVGQDIDETCIHMCYIQLSLHGLSGYVIHGNTLTKPEPELPKDLKNIWFTPMWFNEVWSLRRLFHNQDILGRTIAEKKEVKAE